VPSVILHTIFGEDVFTALHGRLAEKTAPNFSPEKIFTDYRSAFVLGCQGPDIFYHSQRLKPAALEYGSLLHRRGYGAFTACLLQKSLSLTNFDALSAYSLGFITHAFLDRACHPYIIYFCGKELHSFFERIIDVLMLRELRSNDPSSWDQELLLAEICEAPPSAIKEHLFNSFTETFPEKANKDRNLFKRIDNAFADCARFYNMSSPSKIKIESSDSSIQKRKFTRRAVNYVYPENLAEDIDFLNKNRKPWRYPHIPSNGQMPKEDTRSFLDIYAGAVKTAVDTLAPIFTQYFESGVFPSETAERIGNQCLSILDENGKPCAPNLTEPFPLEEVFNQQAKLRGVI
jgi:hypothetical protein